MARVPFLMQWYPTPTANSGVFIQERARAVSLYYDVDVLVIEGCHPRLTGKYRISRPTGQVPPTIRLSYAKPRLPKTGWLRQLGGVHRVLEEMKKSRRMPDIIHANIYSAATLGLEIGRRYDRPVVLSEHSSAYPRNLFTKLEALKNRLTLNRLDLIMPVSENLVIQMKRYGIKGPFQVVPNTVDTSLFVPDFSTAGSRHRVVAANLNKNKAVNVFLKSLSLVRPSLPDFTATIVGEGPERRYLEDLSKELHLDDRVEFLGLKTKAPATSTSSKAGPANSPKP